MPLKEHYQGNVNRVLTRREAYIDVGISEEKGKRKKKKKGGGGMGAGAWDGMLFKRSKPKSTMTAKGNPFPLAFSFIPAFRLFQEKDRVQVFFI